MECSGVKKLLSEYIDNALDAQNKAVVEEHLAGCKACSEELAALKLCVNELNSLKEMEAPSDFAEKVHERIERRFEFEKIMHALFIPLRIKVPLQLVTVAATVILVMTIYKSMQPEIQLAQVPTAIKSAVVLKEVAGLPVEKPAERPMRAARKIAPAQPPLELSHVGEDIAKELTKIARIEEEFDEMVPADLTASMQATAVVKTPIKVARVEEKTAEKPAAIPSLAEPAEVVLEKPDPKPIQLALVIKSEQAEEPKKISIAALSELAKSLPSEDSKRRTGTTSTYKGMPKPSGKARKYPESLHTILGEIVRLLMGLEGKVVDVEYDKEGLRPESLTAEIPSRHYRQFLRELKRYGSVQGPPEDAPVIAVEPVPVVIKFIDREK